MSGFWKFEDCLIRVQWDNSICDELELSHVMIIMTIVNIILKGGNSVDQIIEMMWFVNVVKEGGIRRNNCVWLTI